MTADGHAQRRGVRRRLRPGEPVVRCAVTLTLLYPGDEVAQCLKCSRCHRLDGWRSNGGCASPGCPNGPSSRTASPPHRPPTRSPAPVETAAVPPRPPPVVTPARVAEIRPAAPPPPPPTPTSTHTHRERPIPEPMIVRIANDRTSARCPFTLDLLQAGSLVARCPSCKQLMSVDGWKANGGCATYGCQSSPDYRKDEPV